MIVKYPSQADANERSKASVPPMSDEFFRRLKDTVSGKSGIQVQDRNREALQVSLLERMKFRGIESYEDYLDYALSESSLSELKHLLDLVTVNETHFFRNPAHMKALRERILPEISRRPDKKTLSVWSAGCATGEEPYSIAIVLMETRPLCPGWRFELVGTDISQAALDAAKQGVYRERSLRGLDERTVRTYFRRQGLLYRVRESVKDAVQLRFSNLTESVMTPVLSDRWDIIFCRNVMIYFSAETRATVVDRLHELLDGDGYFFLGHSESLFGVHEGYRLEELDGCFVYRPASRQETDAAASKRVRGRRKPLGEESDLGAAERAERPAAALEEEPSSIPALTQEDEREAEVEFGLPEAKGQVKDDLVRALAWINRSKNGEAARLCRKVLSKAPDCAEAHFLLGVVQSEQGSEDRAILHFNAAIGLDPNLVMSLFQRAESEARMGRIKQARESYRGALRTLRHVHRDAPVRFGGGLTAGLLVATCGRKLRELT